MNAMAEEKESLKDEMRNVVEEARMVIPGIQALFGFQTIAVFNNRFADLADSAKYAYLIALGLLVLAIALLMTPAAYHRLAERSHVSRRMIDLSSNLITAGMIPLLCAFAIDVYVVILAAIDSPQFAWLGAIATAFVCAGLWFFFPIKRAKSLKQPV
jgi:hypothetical protein